MRPRPESADSDTHDHSVADVLLRQEPDEEEDEEEDDGTPVAPGCSDAVCCARRAVFDRRVSRPLVQSYTLPGLAQPLS